MRRQIVPRLLVAGLIAGGSGVALPAGSLPVVKGQEAVASVNGEPVTLAEMMTRLGSMHRGFADSPSAPARPDPMAVLQRMIDARLVVQEAHRIGFDELPEVKAQVEAIRLGLLKNGLVRRQTREITAAEPGAADRLYRDLVREMNLALVLFKTEEAAKKFADAVKAPAAFDDLAAKAVASGDAVRSQAPQFVKASELRPEVTEAAKALKAGGVSKPFRLQDGYAVMKLLGTRYPEDAAARRSAEEQAVQAKKETRIAQYNDDLRKRYATVRKDVLATLDYEAPKPGLEALRKDRRVVAGIKGGPPVTVEDLTHRIEQQFYHSVEDAIARKRVNGEVPLILDRLMVERAVAVEAKRLGIEKTDAFKAGLKEQTDSLLFETFVKKIVNPEVKMNEDDLKAYHDRHKGDFMSPGMIRLESLAFVKEADARAALERLRAGADLKWMRTNSGGQATAEAFPGLVDLRGNLLALDSLPAGMHDALAGAGAGDVRYYAAPSGPSYALLVRQAMPPAPQPYDTVREQVSVRVFEAKRKAVMDDWVAKLRAGSEVTIYAKGADLSQALGLGTGAGK